MYEFSYTSQYIDEEEHKGLNLATRSRARRGYGIYTSIKVLPVPAPDAGTGYPPKGRENESNNRSRADRRKKNRRSNYGTGRKDQGEGPSKQEGNQGGKTEAAEPKKQNNCRLLSNTNQARNLRSKSPVWS